MNARHTTSIISMPGSPAIEEALARFRALPASGHDDLGRVLGNVALNLLDLSFQVRLDSCRRARAFELVDEWRTETARADAAIAAFAAANPPLLLPSDFASPHAAGEGAGPVPGNGGRAHTSGPQASPCAAIATDPGRGLSHNPAPAGDAPVLLASCDDFIAALPE